MEGIQVVYDGAAEALPLAACGAAAPAKETTVLRRNAEPWSVRATDGSIQVFGDDGARLRSRRVAGRIARADIADLDGDHHSEVIVGVSGGEDSGNLIVFDHGGTRL